MPYRDKRERLEFSRERGGALLLLVNEAIPLQMTHEGHLLSTSTAQLPRTAQWRPPLGRDG